ncbi:hypothetical protein MMC17_008603 [Xylographa soralifera]|nr:hypothetical protein [Xylographa soralifera]
MSFPEAVTSVALPFCKTPFGRLPSELRNMIYELVFDVHRKVPTQEQIDESKEWEGKPSGAYIDHFCYKDLYSDSDDSDVSDDDSDSYFPPESYYLERPRLWYPKDSFRIVPEHSKPPYIGMTRVITESEEVRYVEIPAPHTRYSSQNQIQMLHPLLCTCQQISSKATAMYLNPRVLSVRSSLVPKFLRILTADYWPFITSLKLWCEGREPKKDQKKDFAPVINEKGILRLVKCYNLSKLFIHGYYGTGRKDELSGLGGLAYGTITIDDSPMHDWYYRVQKMQDEKYDRLLANAKALIDLSKEARRVREAESRMGSLTMNQRVSMASTDERDNRVSITRPE